MGIWSLAEIWEFGDWGLSKLEDCSIAMTDGLQKFVELTQQIIAPCSEVHKIIRPGLEERFYKNPLIEEFL